MPARIGVEQRIPNAITVPVQCQRIPDIAEVAVLRQEIPLYRIVIPCPQVPAMDVRVVTLRIERVLIVILRASEGRVAVACVICAFTLAVFLVVSVTIAIITGISFITSLYK